MQIQLMYKATPELTRYWRDWWLASYTLTVPYIFQFLIFNKFLEISKNIFNSEATVHDVNTKSVSDKNGHMDLFPEINIL